LGSGDGGLGSGAGGLGPTPTPQSPIPNPQSPISVKIIKKNKINKTKIKIIT